MKKTISILPSVVMMFCYLTFFSSAEGYVNAIKPNDFIVKSEGVQPLYDIIHSLTLDVDENQVEAIVETDIKTSLRITITIYQQKGSGWSFLAKKTFSGSNTRTLTGVIAYDFQLGITYKAVADFNAGGETDSMEDIFSF